MKKFLGLMLAAVAVSFAVPAHAQQPGSTLSRVAGEFIASNYQYRSSVVQGTSSTGVGTIIVSNPQALPDGRIVIPFSVTAPVSVDGETETPSSVSATSCPTNAVGSAGCTAITATWSAIHPGGQNDVTSGTFGLQEAILDAAGCQGSSALGIACTGNGGIVVVDKSWSGTNTQLNTAVPFPTVTIEDKRSSVPSYWKPQQSTATVIAAMPTLTATTVGFAINGANATTGTYVGANTYHYATACVDLMGNESQPSADFSGATAGTGSTNQIGFLAPVAQTGCVGYVPYISLTGGTYALSYRVPLATFSAGVATANGVCALTTLETVTPACSIANTTYGQLGANAIVSALTVNTARIWVGVGGASTTADVVGNSNARQSYAYVPSASLAAPFNQSALAFSAGTGPATAVPVVLGTIHLPPGYMNFVGKRIRICGNGTSQGGSTATVDVVEFYWDADGSNTTGAGVILPAAKITNTLSATPAMSFCQELTTTVAGTGVTAGSIFVGKGELGETMSVAATTAANFFTVPNIVVAGSTVASLNLAQEARIDVSLLHTTGTDGTWTLNDLTVEELN